MYIQFYNVSCQFERHGKIADVVIKRSQDIANIVSSVSFVVYCCQLVFKMLFRKLLMKC